MLPYDTTTNTIRRPCSELDHDAPCLPLREQIEAATDVAKTKPM
jgi:hypothetical protein